MTTQTDLSPAVLAVLHAEQAHRRALKRAELARGEQATLLWIEADDAYVRFCRAVLALEGETE